MRVLSDVQKVIFRTDNDIASDADELYLDAIDIYRDEHRSMDDAITAMKQVLSKYPDHARSLTILGFMEEERLSIIEDVARLKETLRLDPHNGESRIQFAYLLTTLGRVNEAREEWAKLSDGSVHRWAKHARKMLRKFS